MKCLSTIFLGIMAFANSNSASAQVEKEKYRDQEWIFGTDASGAPGVDGTLLDFSSSPPQSKYVIKPIEQYISSASICDTAGKLAFYTNGYQVVNGKQKKVYNTELLDSGDDANVGGLPTPQGLLLLPVPGDDDLYVPDPSPHKIYQCCC